MEQGYSFVGDNTPETLIVCWIIWYIIEALNSHSFAMEFVKTCNFKTFQSGNLALKPFFAFFSTIYMLKSLFVKIFQQNTSLNLEKCKGVSIDLYLAWYLGWDTVHLDTNSNSSRWSLSKFVVSKHLWWEFLHGEPRFCLEF